MNVSPPGHAPLWAYGVLVGISTGYPPVAGRFHTCYSPVRRSPAGKASFAPAAPRLACVRPVASVHPEPGSNSPLLLSFSSFFLSIIRPRKSSPPKLRYLSRLSDAQIYRFYTCAKNHCDVDSVTFSCVTAAPVRTPHLPCLSLFLVYRNHFNELIFLQTRQHSCRLKAAPQAGPEPSGLTPDFPIAVAKVLQKTNTNQIFQQLFFKNFSQIFVKPYQPTSYKRKNLCCKTSFFFHIL